MTLQELIDGAIFIAGAQNADAQAESLLPVVFQNVALKFAATEEGRSLLRRTVTVALTDGVGTLPAEVLTSCKFGASIANPDDVTMAQTQTLVPNWSDFIQPRNHLDSQFNWWTVKGDHALVLLQPEEIYDPASGFTGDIEYTGAAVPEIPAAAGSTIDAPEEVTSDLLEALANAIKGEIAAA